MWGNVTVLEEHTSGTPLYTSYRWYTPEKFWYTLGCTIHPVDKHWPTVRIAGHQGSHKCWLEIPLRWVQNSQNFPRFCTKQYVGECGLQSTLFCIFNHSYFISSPNKLKICHTMKQLLKICHTMKQLLHTMKQLYIHNIMPKHESNVLQKNFTTNLKRVLFCWMCTMPGVHSTWALGGYTWPFNKKLGSITFTWYPM